MSFTPSRAAVGARRRPLLAGALAAWGALGLSGACTAGGSGAEDENSATARRLRAAAVRQSRSLLARYDGTSTTHTALADRLRPLRSQVARHAEALGGAGAARITRTSRAAVSPDEKRALADLAEAERHAADARTRALASAPPELARLLASVAAAGAAHAYLLGSEDLGGGA